MAKQFVEIEIDVPDGWEFVRFGTAEEGDTILSVRSPEKTPQSEIGCRYNRIIVRPAWQWPKWLTAPWIAMDKNGDWFGYDREPKRRDVTWAGQSSLVKYRQLDNIEYVAFDPPACDDWKQSLRRNPHATEATEAK